MTKRIGRGGICTDCGKRRQDTSVLGPELCTVCLDYAHWENTHSDDGHGPDLEEAADEAYPMAECPVCHPELDVRYVFKTGHKNTVAKTHTSHAGHGHMVTPAARAACRKFMAAHNGMDEVTYRVSVREAELDDANEN